MRQGVLIVSVIILVAALAMLNNGIHKVAPTDQEANTPPPTQKAASTVTTPLPPLAPEEAIGDPARAKYRITVGWRYDTVNQADPSQLIQSVDVARQFAKRSSSMVAMEIVDLDVPPANRSPAARAVKTLGITINGKPAPRLRSNPGEGTTNPDYINHLLPYLTHL